MKILFKFYFALLLIANTAFAQKQTYDVVNFSIPNGWDKTELPNGIQLSTKDDGYGNYAATVIVHTVETTASATENFNNSWQALVKGTVKVNEKPAMQQPEKDKGWEIISGQAKYTDGSNKGSVTLITATGNGKMANVVIMANTNKYQEEILTFVNSLELNENATAQNTTQGSATNNTIDFAGTWIATSSLNTGNLGSSYVENEYIFNNDGTYNFYSKTFSQTISNLILKREKGTFIVSGKQITLMPKTSVTESWSKKNGGDEFGKLLSSQKNSLEKTTYTVTKHYFEGIKEWNLVLQADTPTKRDGPFSTNTLFKNAYYYSMPSSYKQAIKLP